MSKPTVAIVGASADPAKFAHKSLVAHRDCGYEVYPVHPDGGEIDGLKVYPTVADAPVARFDRVSMYVRPSIGLTLLEGIAQKGCDELWLNPGTESPDVVAEAQRLGLNAIQACSIVDCRGR